MKFNNTSRSLSAIIALAAFSSPTLGQDEKVTITYNAVQSKTAFLSKLDQFFIDAVEERSGGNITFDTYYSETLGGQKEIIPLLAAGAVTIGGIIPGYHSGEMPFASLANAVPATFSTDNVLQISRRMYEENPAAIAELNRVGIHPLILRHMGPYTLLCTKPIRNMKDLEGVKVRSYGAYIPVMLEAIGAIPVAMGFTETYEGLQRGSIDCSFLSRALSEEAGLHEVANYLMDFNFGSISAYTMFVSNDIWNSWSAETRNLIDQAAREAEKMSVPVSEATEATAMEIMIASGVELVAFEEHEALNARLPNMLDIWESRVISQLPEQKDSVQNTKRLINEWVAESEQ